MEEVEKGVGGSEVKRGMRNIEELDENWQIRLTDKGEREREIGVLLQLGINEPFVMLSVFCLQGCSQALDWVPMEETCPNWLTCTNTHICTKHTDE